MQNPTKQSFLATADRIIFKLEHLLNLAGGLVVFGALLLGVLHVALRFIFDSQVSGYVDWMEQLMVIFGFLGLAYAQRTNGHIRMDIVVNTLKGRTLWVVELITTVLASALMFALTIGAYKHFERSFVWGDSTFDIEIQLWYAKVLVVISFVFISLRLLLQIFAYMRLVLNPQADPIAIPERISDEISDSAEGNP